MKKAFLGFILGLFVCLSFQAFAEKIAVLKATEATFDIYVNENKFESDKPSVVIDGSTYLPLRETGDALGVSVEWNNTEKRVEIGMGKIKAEKINDTNIKSMSLNINDGEIYGAPVVMADEKYYIRPTVLYSYVKTQGKNISIELPNKEPILFQSNNEVTSYAIKVEGLAYIDLEACEIKSTLDSTTNTLWIEMQ